METRIIRQQTKQVSPDKEKTITPKPNDKVRVQYIQNNQIVDQAAKMPLAHADDAADEVENVEYLDESIVEEYTQAMDAIAHSAEVGGKEDMSKLEEFKDTFYPNAIHCLIALYRAKYEKMCDKGVQGIKTENVWKEISKDMNESYFDFSSEQLYQKFKQLRQQYFNVCNVDAMIEFEYFIHLHEVYKDKVIDSIETGSSVDVAMVQLQRVYPDDVLFQEQALECNGDIALISYKNGDAAAHEIEVETHQDDITHKENEFIDMVEKELQAMEEGKIIAASQIQQMPNTHSHDLPNADYKGKATHVLPVEICPINTVVVKRELEVADTMPQLLPAKRFRSEVLASMNNVTTTTISDTLQQTQIAASVIDEADQNKQALHATQMSVNATAASNALPGKCKEMSLADYNAAQQQRHQEKMELLRHSLQLQERTMELQQLIMEQLIKRL